MEEGLVLTGMEDVGAVAEAVDLARAEVLKVVARWGLARPWDDASRAAVMRLVRESEAGRQRRLLLRTGAGDPAPYGGSLAMPDRATVLAELEPWMRLASPGREVWVEIGNEPLIADQASEQLAWDYTWYLRGAIAAVRGRWPGVHIVAPAHLLNHQVRLGAYADGVARWLAIAKDVYRQCQALGLHAYTLEQAVRGIVQLRELVSPTLPIWCTEFALNVDLEPAERAQRYREVLAALPIDVVCYYHLNDLGGADPTHHNPRYTLDRGTLAALGQPAAGVDLGAAPARLAITWAGMTRPHFQAGRPGPIRAIVVHATAGRGPGDLAWLRKGGDERRPVSCHYYISKAGAISQLVKDEDTAWHAGVSRWPVDGRVVEGLNPVAVGIELENKNDGRDPYPAAQVAAAVALVRELARRHHVPREQLVRHLDISPGRKTDPAGFPWASLVAQVYTRAYATREPTPVHEGRGQQFPVALGGSCVLPAGTRVAVDDVTAGWAHLADGRGFVLLRQLAEV